MAQSLLRLAGLHWPVPDYSTVSRRQKTLQVAIGATPTTTGLHLLVDSTGIKMLGEGEWKTKKHGADYRRQWRKVHLGIDASTLEIRAMEVTDNSIGDAPVLPALLDQIPADESIASVSGDGAYDTKDCHEAIALRAAHAIIPTARTPGEPLRCRCTQRDLAHDAQTGSGDLEKVERLPPAQSCRNQNALLQAVGRTGHGTRLRSSGGRIADTRCRAQPLHSAGYPGHGPSVIKLITNSVSSAFTRFAQQSRPFLVPTQIICTVACWTTVRHAR